MIDLFFHVTAKLKLFQMPLSFGELKQHYTLRLPQNANLKHFMWFDAQFSI